MGLHAVSGAFGQDVETGSALPTGVETGHLFVLRVGSGDTAARWLLQFDSTITDAYKWRFLGGAALEAEVATAQTTASASYVDLATSGPAVTLPTAGVFDVQHGHGSQTGTSSQAAMSYAIGGSAAVDADYSLVELRAASVTNQMAMRQKRQTISSVVTLTAKYKALSGTASFQDRWLLVVPVRLG